LWDHILCRLDMVRRRGRRCHLTRVVVRGVPAALVLKVRQACCTTCTRSTRKRVPTSASSTALVVGHGGT
jgi:hypothetical protein